MRRRRTDSSPPVPRWLCPRCGHGHHAADLVRIVMVVCNSLAQEREASHCRVQGSAPCSAPELRQIRVAFRKAEASSRSGRDEVCCSCKPLLFRERRCRDNPIASTFQKVLANVGQFGIAGRHQNRLSSLLSRASLKEYQTAMT